MNPTPVVDGAKEKRTKKSKKEKKTKKVKKSTVVTLYENDVTRTNSAPAGDGVKEEKKKSKNKKKAKKEKNLQKSEITAIKVPNRI